MKHPLTLSLILLVAALALVPLFALCDRFDD